VYIICDDEYHQPLRPGGSGGVKATDIQYPFLYVHWHYTVL